MVNGIHGSQTQNTNGEGPATGEEVRFDVTFNAPIILPGDHYFFRPEVQLTDGIFLWLSAAKPIAAPGTGFPPGFTDLQTWIRNDDLAPDWLRIGTDIIGGNPATQHNASFSLSGEAVPEPSSLVLMGVAGAAPGSTSPPTADGSEVPGTARDIPRVDGGGIVRIGTNRTPGLRPFHASQARRPRPLEDAPAAPSRSASGAWEPAARVPEPVIRGACPPPRRGNGSAGRVG